MQDAARTAVFLAGTTPVCVELSPGCGWFAAQAENEDLVLSPFGVIQGRVAFLRRVAPGILETHRVSHPLFGTPQTHQVVLTLLERLEDACEKLDELVHQLDRTDREVFFMYMVDGRRPNVIGRRLVERREGNVRPTEGNIPISPFWVYSQLAHDQALLRRMTAYHRGKVIPILRSQPQKRWNCPPAGEGHTPSPDIQVRLTERFLVDWKQALRVMWPLHRVDQNEPDGQDTVDVFVTQIRVHDATPPSLPPGSDAS